MVWLYGAYVVFMTMLLCYWLWDVLSAREKEKKLEYEWAKRDRELGIKYDERPTTDASVYSKRNT